MRTLPLVSLAAAAALLAGSAFAAPPQDTAAPSEIQVRGPAPAPEKYTMNTQQLREIAGTYALSNGQSLRLSTWQNRLYADLNQRGMTEMVPVDENVFVAASHDMSMVFKPVAFGDELRLTYRADSGQTAALPQLVTVTLALNR